MPYPVSHTKSLLSIVSCPSVSPAILFLVHRRNYAEALIAFHKSPFLSSHALWKHRTLHCWQGGQLFLVRQLCQIETKDLCACLADAKVSLKRMKVKKMNEQLKTRACGLISTAFLGCA